MNNLILIVMTFNYSLVTLVLFIGLMSCKNDASIPDEFNIVGQWISTDKSDTLLFENTNKIMYHSATIAHSEPYHYQLLGDSITLTYEGSDDVTLRPTTHLYYMNQNYLSIDFRKTACYGFSKVVINYFKSKPK